MRRLLTTLRSRKGVTMIEYALLAALIALALVAVIGGLRGNIGSVFTRIGTALQ